MLAIKRGSEGGDAVAWRLLAVRFGSPRRRPGRAPLLRCGWAVVQEGVQLLLHVVEGPGASVDAGEHQGAFKAGDARVVTTWTGCTARALPCWLTSLVGCGGTRAALIATMRSGDVRTGPRSRASSSRPSSRRGRRLKTADGRQASHALPAITHGFSSSCFGAATLQADPGRDRPAWPHARGSDHAPVQGSRAP